MEKGLRLRVALWILFADFSLTLPGSHHKTSAKYYNHFSLLKTAK